jgi:hypothetical protein
MDKPEPPIEGEIKLDLQMKKMSGRNKSVLDILQGSDHFVDCDRFYNKVYAAGKLK